ncbi:MAG TPA: TonB-dependent receptor [Steroidobacteraceae bacterium]|nr:TonB-dependent receptor [Steroidobacteraceae bacterium]
MRQFSSARGSGWALAAVASPLIIGSTSLAQDKPASDVLEEVTVTAQRRVQDLQDVPIAATVLTGEMLEAKGVNGIYQLQYAAPSLTMADYGSANVLNIRGIGRSAVDIELPSGVVLYRDGVPTFPGYFQNEPYFDIGSIEVLKGPQGTFVGKSAAGGAIFINTASPKLHELSGNVEAEVANFSQLAATGIVNVPMGDTFAMRFGFRHLQRDDVMVDSLSGPFTGRPGRPNLNSLRMGALWKPNDKIDENFRLDLSDLDFGGNLTTSYGYPLFDLVQNCDYMYRDRSVRGVNNFKYDFEGGLVLSSVTGYQRTHTINNFDRNGNQPRVNIFDSEGTFTLYSQEFNLVSPDNAGPFSYVVGVFVQRTDSVILDWRQAGFNVTGEAGDLGGFVQGSLYPYLGLDKDYTKREDEIAGFVDLKYDLSESWETEVGLRYSDYDLAQDTDIVIGDGLTPPTIPFFVGQQHLSEGDFDAKVSVTYKVTQDQNVFALISKAHVTGGFNIIGGDEFKPEEIWDYEAGWKGTWSGGRVRTQIGAYYQTFSNYQAQFANADLAGQNELQNAEGTSEVYGFEAALQAKFGAFSIDTSLALLDSKLGTFPNVISPFLPPPDNVITITGGETPFAPKVSFNIGASYEFQTGGGMKITPRIDLSSQSEQSGSLIVNPATRLNARTLLNAGLRFEMGNWYADLAGTNLTDERYVAGIQDLGNIWYPCAPRQYGIKVGINF